MYYYKNKLHIIIESYRKRIENNKLIKKHTNIELKNEDPHEPLSSKYYYVQA